MANKITALELWDGDYLNREDCLVWYGDRRITHVIREGQVAKACEPNYDGCVARVSVYTSCFEVETIDEARMRAYCHTLIDQSPALREIYIELRQTYSP